MVRLMEMGKGPFQTEAIAETKVWGQDSHGWLWEMLMVPLATGLGEWGVGARQTWKALGSSGILLLECVLGILGGGEGSLLGWSPSSWGRELTGCHIAPFHLGEAEKLDFPQSRHAQKHPCYLESSSQGPITSQAFDSPGSGSGWSHSMLNVDLSMSDEKPLWPYSPGERKVNPSCMWGCPALPHPQSV